VNGSEDASNGLAARIIELAAPPARAIFGHWSIDPIYHYQSAAPIDILTGTTGSIGGTG